MIDTTTIHDPSSGSLQVYRVPLAALTLTAAEDAAALDSVGSTLVEATMKLEVDAGLSAGYRGFYSCGG